MTAQRLGRLAREKNATPRASRFRFDEDTRVAVALECRAEVNLALALDIAPAQSEDFGQPHARREGQNEDGLERFHQQHQDDQQEAKRDRRQERE